MTQYSAQLRAGSMLNDRYKIICELGRGGFGRAYLAEDTQRYREKCVLKEFAPDVENSEELRKAEELFEREAGILYQLNHEQIPKFIALLKVRIDRKDSLFLVQEYIDGKSYWDLLRDKGRFSEKEVTQLILDLLPVLEYIHSLNLVHRDIAPDNLIERRSDGEPVLIDFGCVKAAANAVSKSTGMPVATMLGKKGYAPEEQMQHGRAFPSSDFYALAVTVLVLLIGKQPQDFYDSYHATWKWRKEVKISSNLGKVLDKMLAHNPSDRYQSVKDIKRALERQNNSGLEKMISRVRTLVVAPKQPSELVEKNRPTSSSEPKNGKNIARFFVKVNDAFALVKNKISETIKDRRERASREIERHKNPDQNRQKNNFFLGRIILIGGALAVPGIITFSFVQGLLSPFDSPLKPTNSSLAQTEKQRQANIYQEVKKRNIDPSSFYQEVDRIFYQRYPQMKGVQLTEKPEHQKYRDRWNTVAEDLLDERKKN